MRALKSPLVTIQRKPYKIAFYMRVASKDQIENLKIRFRDQEERLRNAARGFGELVAIYKDVQSGRDANRPQLRKLLSGISHRKIDLVMVTDLSRLSRNVQALSEIYELSRSKGCAVMSLSEPFDSTGLSAVLSQCMGSK